MNAEIVILTPIIEEYQAVRKHLAELNYVQLNRNSCEVGVFPIHGQLVKIAICQTNSGNLEISIATKDCISFFKPKYIFLTGTAGGFKKLNIGDVVIGDKGYGYEGGKEYNTGFSVRPKVSYSDVELVVLAKKIALSRNWQKNILLEKTLIKEINVKVGPIASGEKVVATRDAEMYQFIHKHYNDTVAIEMEAYGFLNALVDYPNVKGLNIRSISDLLAGKALANEKGSKKLASAIAAGFLFSLIEILPIKKTSKKKYFFATLLLLLAVFLGTNYTIQYLDHQRENKTVDTTFVDSLSMSDTVDSLENNEEKPPPVTEPVMSEKKKIISAPEAIIDTIVEEEKEKEEEQLHEVLIAVDISGTQYFIKDEKQNIIKKGQSHQTFNFPKGDYEITFFYKGDTLTEYFSLPKHQIKTLYFNK